MFKHYLTTALRHFRQHKVTTSINVVCLTIGLVCFLAIYAMVTYLNRGDRHFANADRIYMITWQVNSSPVAAFGPSLTAKYLKTDFPEIKTVARTTFDSGFASEIPVSAGDRKSFVHVVYADPEFLDVFALPFLAGDSTNALRVPNSAVISKDAAIKLFGSAENAVGHTLRLQDGREISVRAVLDALKQPSHITTSGDNSIGLVRFDVMFSMDVLENEVSSSPVRRQLTAANWTSPFFFTYVVLPEDGSLTVEALRNRLKSFGERHANANGISVHFDAWSVGDYWLNSMGALTGTHKTGISATLMFYFLGGLVVLTSCLNYANLATAQATTRAKEIGMRRVVGARREQIAAQFMLEAALLSFAALFCAAALIALTIATMQLPSTVSIALSVITMPSFWLTLLTLLVIVSIAAGTYPAFVLSSVRPIQAVRVGKVRSGGRSAAHLLVGVQFLATSFLLISMLVMVAQNREFKRSVISSSSDALVVLSNSVADAGVDYEMLRSALLRQPHIQGVSASAVSPWMMMAPSASLTTSLAEAARRIYAKPNSVNYDFFSAMDIRLIAGRVFDREHANDNALRTVSNVIPNVVIDRALAEKSGWPNPEDALGKTLYESGFSNAGKSPLPRTIIGVVENRAMSIISPDGANSNIYLLTPATAVYPIVRISNKDGAAALKEIESIWNQLAPSIALKMRFADDSLNRSYQWIEAISTAFIDVAVLAMAISLLGLIGLSVHVIGRRRHEIGVRKTLGASVKGIVRLLLTDFSKPVIFANVLAWPIAFIAMELYLSVFTQRITLSVTPFITSLLITVLIACVAVASQATRAARMNPATVLRDE